jgi:hypothetical protein
MPRVVPSQVIAFIDTNPLPPAEGFTTTLYNIDTAEFSGLGDLLDQIPGELLTMDAATSGCCQHTYRSQGPGKTASDPH